MSEIIVKLRNYLTRREKRVFLLLVIAMFLGALLELIGIGSVLPVIAAFVEPQRFMQNVHVQDLFKIFSWLTPDRFMILICAVTGIFFLLKNVFLYLVTHLQITYSFRISIRAASDLLEKYLSAPFELYRTRNSTEFLELIQSARIVFAESVNALMMISSELLTLAILFLAIFFFFPKLTLFIMGIMILFSLGIYFPIRRLIARSGDLCFDENRSLSEFLLSAIESIREVKLSGRSGYFRTVGFKRIANSIDLSRRLFSYSQMPRFLIESLSVFTGMGIIILLLILGIRSNEIIMGVSFLGLSMVRIMPSVSRIHYHLARLKGYSAEFKMIFDDLERVQAEVLTGKSDLPALTLEHELRFEDVSFSFGGKTILDHVSFTLPAKTSLALAGPTGCGKTTMLDLFAGLNIPGSGRILADGRDIRENLASWRAITGYVPQTVHIADADVWENVAFGIPRDQIDRERVRECLREAQALEFAEQLEHGLDTVLGQAGKRISGGQRQRIGIARALYPEPALLLFDEATSALDPETEAVFLDSFARLNGKYTMITAAHKDVVLKSCKNIFHFRAVPQDSR